jgi:uncharacterized integral membrane protein
MRTSTVIKIISFILFLVLMIFFVFENLDPVTIWIPLFKGRHIGLIYIILVSYAFGLSSAMWGMTFFRAEMRRRQRQEEVPEEDQPLFEDEE